MPKLRVTALDEAFGGTRSFDSALADYQSRRDAQVLPMYEFTTDSRPWSHLRPSCNSYWQLSPATKTPWTVSLK